MTTACVTPACSSASTRYKVYIGPGKYFVTSDVGDGRVQWYSFLACPPGTKRAGDTWEEGSTSDAQGNDVISYLKGAPPTHPDQ